MAILIDLKNKPIVFDYVQNGVTITDKNSTIVYVNPAFSKITGYTKEEAIGKNPAILHSGRHKREFYEDMWKKVSEQGFWEGEIWNRKKSGDVYPEFLTISKVGQKNSADSHYIAVFSDISFLKKDVKKTFHLAFYDPLTNLPNRNLFHDRVNHAVQSAKGRGDKNLAFAYMDLDKFKQVNDTYGHYTGDMLLKLVGKRLADNIRSGDTIARMGGDEFTAILTSADNELSASHFAERVLQSIEKPFIIDEHDIRISISIGLSFFPKDGDNVEILLTRADKAMYTAKKTGKKIVTYDEIK